MPTGTAGDDHLIGTSADEIFDLTLGGNDYVAGKGGADLFQMGATFAKGDRLFGGLGADTVSLDGDYSGGLTLKANMLHDIEKLSLAAGHGYKLIATDANVGAGLTFTVDAGTLGDQDTLIFNGAAELDGKFEIIGGAGDDVLTGGAGNDLFNLTHGGTDRVNGGGGDNVFNLGATFDPTDRIDGGNATGNTNLFLNGDYDIVLQANTMKNIFNLGLQGAHNYKIVLKDGNVAAGAAQFVNSYLINAGQTTVIDGSAETDGHFFMNAGASDDLLIGGALADHFTLPFGGDDTVKGGGGDDEIVFTNVLTAADRIDGGTGNDVLTVEGDFSGGLVFGAHSLTSVESIVLHDVGSYVLTSADANVAAGGTLTIDASFLTGSNILNWNGSHETDGKFVLTGGTGNDVLHGGTGADRFSGGAGADTYVYGTVAESTGITYDTILSFNAADAIDLPVAVSAFDSPVVGGKLNTATFDADLTDALDGVSHANANDDLLKANHAVLFTPDQGVYVGETFLVIDANGTSGYQAGADFVIRVTGFEDAPALADLI